jgi:predicted Fe-Mo cluster-binding NifX family protein
MKIAVTAAGPTLEDTVAARFGRCAYFLIVDPESLDDSNCSSASNAWQA